MIYKTEPSIIELDFVNSGIPSRFILGSLSNWEKSAVGDGDYLINMKIECKNFDVPNSWNFRKGWYFIKDGYWYYHRVIGPINLKYRYSPTHNEFLYYPPILGRIPFIYNSFYPVGTEISNIIIYQMIKKGFLPLKATAFLYEGKTFLLIAPSYNGKTTLLRNLLRESDCTVFISEELVFLSEEHLVGVPPYNVSWRDSNKGFILDEKSSSLKSTLPDYVLYYHVSLEDSCKPCKNIPEYPFSEIITYFYESMVSSIMYFEGKNPVLGMQNLYKVLQSKTSFYQVSTNGYNSKKLIEYLDEIIK